MNYRVIALDLDGTLTNNEKEITPLTFQALQKAMDEGSIVVLASGRPTYGIEPVADRLGLDKKGGYVLSYNGGKIVDWRTKEELYAKQLRPELIPLLYDYARSRDYALLGYNGPRIITEKPDAPYVREEARINRMPIVGVASLLEEIESQPTKLLLTGDPDDMMHAERELVALLGEKMDIFRSAPFFVELVPKGIDKAQSLERLLGRLGLSAADLIAFGDGYNDLSMLRYAGMGVAMANAAPEVRAEADYITLSNEEDGIAAALRHFEQA